MHRKGVNSELTQISTEAELFFERYAYPDWLRAHSLLVGRITETIVTAREDIGSEARDIALAGYLHDIGRSPLMAGDPREHNELSALILAAEGLAGSVEPARGRGRPRPTGRAARRFTGSCPRRPPPPRSPTRSCTSRTAAEACGSSRW